MSANPFAVVTVRKPGRARPAMDRPRQPAQEEDDPFAAVSVRPTAPSPRQPTPLAPVQVTAEAPQNPLEMALSRAKLAERGQMQGQFFKEKPVDWKNVGAMAGRGLAETGYATAQGVANLLDRLPGIESAGETMRRGREEMRQFYGEPESDAARAAMLGTQMLGTAAQFFVPGAVVGRAAQAAQAGSRVQRALQLAAAPFGEGGAVRSAASRIASGTAMATPLNLALSQSPEDAAAPAIAQLTAQSENPMIRAINRAATQASQSPLGRFAFETGLDVLAGGAGETMLAGARGARRLAGTAMPEAPMPAIPSRQTQETIDRAAFTSKLNRALEAGNDAEIARLLERQQQLRPLDEQLEDALDRQANASGKKAKQRADAEVERVLTLMDQQALPMQGPQQWRGPQRFAEAPDQMTLREELTDTGKQLVERIKRLQPGLSTEEVTPAFVDRLYSRVEKRLGEAPFARGTGQQWAAQLAKNTAKGEREFTGIDTFLQENADKVLSRKDVQDVFNANRVQLKETMYGSTGAQLSDGGRRPDLERAADRPTKFGRYTVPGEALNYREVLLQQPGPEVFRYPTHWDEPNVLTHVRMSDRTIDGKKTLFVEEVQDDWAQQARKPIGEKDPETGKQPTRGYRTTEQSLEVASLTARQEEEANAMRSLRRQMNKAIDSASALRREAFALEQQGTQPDAVVNLRKQEFEYTKQHIELQNQLDELAAQNLATTSRLRQMGAYSGEGPLPGNRPFKQTAEWTELGLKRAIDEAVQGGYDQVALVTGKQAADVYDLRKQVDSLVWEVGDNVDGGTLHGYKGGRKIFDKWMMANELADNVGSEVAKTLQRRAGESDNLVGRVAGEDFEVGGKGMQTFYDTMLPNVIRDYSKKLGVPLSVRRVGSADEVALRAQAKQLRQARTQTNVREEVDAINQQLLALRSQIADAEEGRAGAGNLVIDITPQLRQKVFTEGQPLWAMGGGEAAGAALGAGAGATQGETEEERMRNAMLMAGMLGLPGGARRSVPAITQEVRSVGRFGFVKPPETYMLDDVLEREHVSNVLARTERSLSSIGARTEETANGAGLFGGEVSPNSILRFAEDATDDDIRLSAAMRGLAFGQDQQLWYRKARPNDPSGTAGIVITGPDFAELPDEAINAIVTRLQAEDALGPYGGATRDGNHLLALNLKRYTEMEDDAFQQAVNRAIADVSQSYDINIHPSFYYAEHLDGNADYARAIGRRPDALRAARAALMDAQPEYLRYAEAVGADVPAVEREIADRIGSIDRLVRQIEKPPPPGNTKDVIPVAQAAKQVYTKFAPLVAESDEVIVPEMTSRLAAMVDEMVAKNVIPREMAQDFYRGATLDQRQIARLALPELREDPKYTLYTVVNSILSSGQQVPVETRQGLNVFEQYLQTSKREADGRLIPGRFSILNPEGAQYKQAVTGGKKAFTGERGTGFLGERMAASPRTLNHEQALARLDALVQSLGEEGAVEALLGTVPIMAGKTVKEERPALTFLFGPKIGQYAMDKLGLPNGGKSTIDLWMARLDYALRGDTEAIQGTKLNDEVSPGMRRRMQAVLAQYAADNNMPESSVQALAWYAIKNAFREARAKEKAQAYATLGSASTESIMTPLTREFSPEPIAQGLVKTPGSYERAVEGWNDPTLRDFAKKTGREGKIAPTAGALAGKVFDIGGALGEGTSALMKTPGGRRLLGNVALGTTGYGLQGADDEKLRETGKGMMALALGSAVYPALKAGVRQGARGIAEQLKQTPRGRYALNLLTRDITTDPAVKQAVEDALAERAQITARFQELAREARALGPTGDRVLSDLIEKEGFAAQELAQMSPDDVATATAVAQRIANQVRELGSRKVEEELISQQTFLKRAESYLPRLYAKYDADGLVEDVAVTHKGKTFRITGEKIRNDNLTPEERDALGEIREASYRLAEAGRRGAQDVSTARLFRTLADMPGVIHPDFKAAKENELMAQLFAKQALKTGDRSAAREALQAAREARAEAKQLAEAYTQPNYAAQWLKKASEGTGYVRLPDTPNMGSLRGAVVRADVADYLHDLPDLASAPGMYRRLLRNWKEIKTVYNVGTQIANVLSNFSVVHAAGIPWWRQAAQFRGAARDLKNYGPATKALTEAGVMGVNMPGFSDVPVKGVAQDVAALRQLAETTRPETRAALEEQGITPYGKLGKLAKKGQIKAEQAYAAGDGIFRVMLYKKYVKDGMTSDEAIAEVMRNMPSYDTRSPILGALRMGPAPFIMYPAKYLPTVLDNIMMHPYRWATLAGTTWAVMDQASRRLYGEIEEQDLPPNRRSSSTFGYLMPGVTQADFPMRPVMQALGLTPSEDRKYTIDAARFTPLSAMTGTPVPGSDLSSQLLGERAPQILQPSGPLMDVAALAMGKNAYTGEDFFSPSDEPLDKALKLGGWAYRMATPTSLGVHTPRVIGDIRRGDLDAAFTNALGILGMRPTMVTPGMQSQLQQRRFEEQMSDARLKLRQELRKARTPEEEARIEQKYEAKMNRLAAKYQQRLDEEEE